MVCGWVSPAVPLRLALRVRRQRVLLLRTIAWRSAVVTIAALSSGAAFRGSVTIVVQPTSTPVPSPPPRLALQHSAEEVAVVSFAFGQSRGAIAVPCAPSLMW